MVLDGGVVELEREIANAPYFHARRNRDAYEISGESFCLLGHKLNPSKQGKPDGIYAEWSWDGSRLIICNDRFGFYPIYYYAREDEIAVSPSITKLLSEGASPELDDAGLAVFLRLGFFVGDRTAFREIRTVPPDASFFWQAGQLQVQEHLAIPKPQHLIRDEVIDSYICLFRSAIQRRLPTNENFAVPLSGGRDSRHVLLELCELGYRPKICVTARYSPPYRNVEVAPAAHLAQELNIEHVVLDQPDTPLQTELTKNLKTNFSSTEHGWFLVLEEYLRGKRVQTFYDGIAGDVLSAGHFLDSQRLAYYETGNFTGLAEHLWTTGESWPASVLPLRLKKRMNQELAISELTREIEKHSNAPNPVGSFFLFNRTRRTVAVCPYGILSSIPEVFSPFLDHDLYDFLASLPATMFLDHELHTETISRAYPQYAHIPYKVKGREVRDKPYFRRSAMEMIRYTLSDRSTRWVRRSYLVTRLLRCLLDEDYSLAFSALGPLATYLVQLEGVAKRGRACS